MKIFINVLLAAIIGVLGWQSINLYQQYSVLSDSSQKITAESEALAKENANLDSDIEYFSDPDNLEKELKGKTNYKDPEEKMIVIVPPKDTQTNQ